MRLQVLDVILGRRVEVPRVETLVLHRTLNDQRSQVLWIHGKSWLLVLVQWRERLQAKLTEVIVIDGAPVGWNLPVVHDLSPAFSIHDQRRQQVRLLFLYDIWRSKTTELFAILLE